jgi:hypothetical protein
VSSRSTQGFAPQAVAIQQTEGVEEDAGVVPPVADAVKARPAGVVAAHGLAVDDAGSRAQAGQRLDDQGGSGPSGHCRRQPSGPRLAENFSAIPQKAEVVCDYSHLD